MISSAEKVTTLNCGNTTCPICYPSKKQPLEQQPFDEQLRLIGNNQQPARDLPYIISLGNGMKISGMTDSDGRTTRVDTQKPTSIMAISMTPPSVARNITCCNTTEYEISLERVYVQSQSRVIGATNDQNVGASVVQVNIPEGEKRKLKTGEITMAHSVFGRGVDYGRVWVHHGGWWLFMGRQDPNTAVTPNGQMYYPNAIYQYDFSSPSIDPKYRALFMHEMTHVWQYQMGYAVKRHGLTVTSRGESAYIYLLNEDSRLCDFNMEQQGNIVSDYYMICVLGNPAKAFNPGKDPDLLRKVMEPFLANPRDKNLLPG